MPYHSADDIKGIGVAGVRGVPTGLAGAGFGGVGGRSGGDGLALDLQFAADKTLTARKGPTPVLTRGSTGTFVGSNGLIQTAAVNAARFDHDPANPTICRGLLIEEGRTNLLLQSENIATTWGRNGVSASTNVDTAPDGSTTADKAVENTAGGLHGITQSVTTVSGSTYIGSIFVKASGRNFAMIYTGASGGNGRYISIPSDGTGTVLGNFSANNSTVTLQYLNNGWYRATIVIAASAATSSLELYTSTNGTTASFTGDGTSGVLAWGGQIELGSFATSYIPTTTSALARSADVCSITGANFTSFYNQPEGTLFIDSNRFDPYTTTYQTMLMANDGTFSNRLSISGRSAGVEFFVSRLGTTEYSLIASSTAIRRKATLAYLSSSTNTSLNGSIGTDDTSSLIPTTNQLVIGVNQVVTSVRYYKKRLANAKLVTLTT